MIDIPSMDSKSTSNTFRVLAFACDGDEKKETDQLREAARKIEAALSNANTSDELKEYNPNDFNDVNKSDYDPTSDTRSLYERLAEQRNKKEEAHEESMKFANQIAWLDEDDVEYLNDLEKNKRQEEMRKKLEASERRKQEIKQEAERRRVEEMKLKETLKRDELGANKNKTKPLVKPGLLGKIKIKAKLKAPDGTSSSSSLT